MSRLECSNCKSIYQDVIRVKKCPLCGSTEFNDIEKNQTGVFSFPRWFTWQGNLGFAYHKSMRTDPEAEL